MDFCIDFATLDLRNRIRSFVEETLLVVARPLLKRNPDTRNWGPVASTNAKE
ncbi:hypothetical protein K2O51_33730 (plasmid) [Cupriavidus pinatubonensis]|uniref:hypothetical protein n=1 Tax=Cupriavidus pinatubonensis TaxID=248026 RepID=UPI001C72B277|nr:hypothetical protein [Cupriavidus pinatubonensis]QYY33804.1 hypothetical protein K2O51_33730 [Cupriavidus pinatubonensis]